MIVYHVPWYPGDPWQTLNGTEHSGRVSYYPVQAIPTLMIDGIEDHWPISQASLTNSLNSRLTVDSPVMINTEASVAVDAVNATVQVTSGNTPVSGNYKIRFGLVCDYYDGWSGSNGQSVWHYDMLDMYPDHNGQAFTIAANQTLEFDVAFNWPLSVNGDPMPEDGLSVVVFVQNDSGHEVIQSDMISVGWAPEDITLNLTPMYDPMYIPSGGGNVVFDAFIGNNYAAPTPGQVRTMAILPNGNEYPINTYNITFIPGYDIVRNGQVQAIPGMAPGGTYSYVAQAGPTPWTVVAEDSFQFIKLGLSADGGDFQIHSSNWLETAGENNSNLNTVPSEFALNAAYPNPFNPSTTVEITLPVASNLTVAVYNVNGQQVSTLHQGMANAGSHSLTFDASGLSTGLYFVHAIVPGQLNEVQKVMLVR